MIAYTGDWEYGVRIVERAKQLNPHHPGWYHYLAVYDAYRRRDYRDALASALKVNMPGYYWPHASLAAVYGQLGEKERAAATLRELHALLPIFGAIAREEYGKWNDPEFVEHLLDGLRKAGARNSSEGKSARLTPRRRRCFRIAAIRHSRANHPLDVMSVFLFSAFAVADRQNERAFQARPFASRAVTAAFSPAHQLAAFFRERDDAAWDRQIDRDLAEDGRLHRVAEEGRVDVRAGRWQDLP